MQKHITNDTTLGIWECSESLFLDLENVCLTKKDHDKYDKIKTESGQKQFVGVRLLLNHLFPTIENIELEKTANGKPYVKGLNEKISISHTGNFVVVLSSKSKDVGVDIELIGDKAITVKNKYMSDIELTILEKLEPALRKEYSHLLWGAKEALFKLYSKGGVSFRNNLLLAPFEYKPSGCFSGNITINNTKIKCELNYFKIRNYMVVCALES